MTRVLAVRLDSDGDVLLTGPAVRCLRGDAEIVDLLVGPGGAQAGALLPEVHEVLVFRAPWSGYQPPPVDAAAVQALVSELRARRYDRMVIFTSFHQSPLPMALLARLAGVPFVAATSVDYPGSLLDVRHTRPPGHEVTAALDLARAAGGRLPDGDDGRLRIRSSVLRSARSTRVVLPLLPDGPFVVLHPGASVPSRALLPDHARALIAALVDDGRPVVVTGGPGERALVADCVRGLRGVVDLAGRTDFAGLAAVLQRAQAVVVGNTGPAHLAAAVGTPVVSLFSPVVPRERWEPYGVPTVVLGDQSAECRGTRARECPLPGHPCLSGITASDVVAAVRTLGPVPAGVGLPGAAS